MSKSSSAEACARLMEGNDVDVADAERDNAIGGHGLGDDSDGIIANRNTDHAVFAFEPIVYLDRKKTLVKGIRVAQVSRVGVDAILALGPRLSRLSTRASGCSERKVSHETTEGPEELEPFTGEGASADSPLKCVHNDWVWRSYMTIDDWCRAPEVPKSRFGRRRAGRRQWRSYRAGSTTP